MGLSVHSHSRDMIARALLVVPPSRKRQRAQGMPGARCTRGLACKGREEKRTRAYRFSGRHSGIPCAMVLRLIRAHPGETGLCCHRHSRRRLRLVRRHLPRGRQACTISPSASARSSRAPQRPPHLTATLVTTREAPLDRMRWAHHRIIFRSCKQNYFEREGLTGFWLTCPSGRIAAPSRPPRAKRVLARVRTMPSREREATSIDRRHGSCRRGAAMRTFPTRALLWILRCRQNRVLR
ncbi:hypothetical protein CI1B_65850 [Bradyrhizobium ivorense]|uniref:Uncharacterized protein n=1 Tax=Bradyrhizobium ivorense TaxID=2511166 RepID=A0A508TQS8_9BRAD|nr:hypothetical protein CI1B_65850 [Bradyrhizobium ivorense]